MPLTSCPWFEQNGAPRYFGTYLASKRLDPETGHYLVRLTVVLGLPEQGPKISIDDLFTTYCARNGPDLDVSLILEEDRIRIWDKHIRNKSEAGAQKLREAAYHAGDGFVFPLNIEQKAIVIPKHYAERLQLKRDIVISATYDDLDPGETFCIHKPRPYEKILKRETKRETAHQR